MLYIYTKYVNICIHSLFGYYKYTLLIAWFLQPCRDDIGYNIGLQNILLKEHVVKIEPRVMLGPRRLLPQMKRDLPDAPHSCGRLFWSFGLPCPHSEDQMKPSNQGHVLCIVKNNPNIIGYMDYKPFWGPFGPDGCCHKQLWQLGSRSCVAQSRSYWNTFGPKGSSTCRLGALN